MQGRQKKTSAIKSRSKQPISRRQTKNQVKPVWQIAAEARALADQQEWRQLPSDLSKHFDDYLYGTARDQD